MPFELECAPAVRDARPAPARQPLDALVTALRAVEASRDALSTSTKKEMDSWK